MDGRSFVIPLPQTTFAEFPDPAMFPSLDGTDDIFLNEVENVVCKNKTKSRT